MFGTGVIFTSGIIPKINAGEIENKGLELVVGYEKINRNFGVNIKLNGAFNRNKVIYMSEVLLPEDFAYRLRSTGYRLVQLFGYVTDGFFNTQKAIHDWYDQYGIRAAPTLGYLTIKDMIREGESGRAAEEER